MNSGYYAAFTGLLAKTQAFELAANNLANINTTGYKAQHEFYRALLANQSGRPLSPLNQAINNFGVLGGGVVDLQPGNMESTGSDLDLAVEGPGFFVIQTPAGERYTRNGDFRLDAAGQLVSQVGYPVMGDQGPIQVPTGPVSISSDGTLSVAGAVAARLRLIEFAPGTLLTPEGESTYVAPAGAAQQAVDSSVRQGVLEASNINPVSGAVSMMALQRHTEMLQRALSLFHTEFNRTAAEELPRV